MPLLTARTETCSCSSFAFVRCKVLSSVSPISAFLSPLLKAIILHDTFGKVLLFSMAQEFFRKRLMETFCAWIFLLQVSLSTSGLVSAFTCFSVATLNFWIASSNVPRAIGGSSHSFPNTIHFPPQTQFFYQRHQLWALQCFRNVHCNLG